MLSQEEKQHSQRDNVLVSSYFENASECKCLMKVEYKYIRATVKCRLSTLTPVRFPILMREPLQNNLFALCYQNGLELREAGGFQRA